MEVKLEGQYWEKRTVKRPRLNLSVIMLIGMDILDMTGVGVAGRKKLSRCRFVGWVWGWRSMAAVKAVFKGRRSYETFVQGGGGRVLLTRQGRSEREWATNGWFLWLGPLLDGAERTTFQSLFISRALLFTGNVASSG